MAKFTIKVLSTTKKTCILSRSYLIKILLSQMNGGLKKRTNIEDRIKNGPKLWFKIDKGRMT